MTARTPVERGAEALDRLQERYAEELHDWGRTADPDEVTPAPPTPYEYTRAVFESIDREGLARAHYDAYRAANPGTLRWDTEPAGIKERFYRRADISIAHLLGTDEGGA